MQHFHKVSLLLIIYGHAIKLPVLIQQDDSFDDSESDATAIQTEVQKSGNREAIVLLMKGMSDECRFQRLMALAMSSSTEKRGRDVWFLHDEKEPPTDKEKVKMLKKAGVFIAPQPKTPDQKSWVSFGDPTSGKTKPSFLAFANSHPEYDNYWLLEDDVFYTGKWGEFFDVPLTEGYDNADVIGQFRVKSGRWVWWRHQWAGQNAKVNRNLCMLKGKDCEHYFEDDKGQVKHDPTVARNGALQFFWPASRFSRKYVAELSKALSEGGTEGHHEALVANFCRSEEWCTMQQLPQMGAYKTSGQTRGQSLTLDALSHNNAPFKLQANHVYHPVKCEDGLQAGTQQLCFSKRDASNPLKEDPNSKCDPVQ